jgi:hypothetical protein
VPGFAAENSGRFMVRPNPFLLPSPSKPLPSPSLSLSLSLSLHHSFSHAPTTSPLCLSCFFPATHPLCECTRKQGWVHECMSENEGMKGAVWWGLGRSITAGNLHCLTACTALCAWSARNTFNSAHLLCISLSPIHSVSHYPTLPWVSSGRLCHRVWHLIS